MLIEKENPSIPVARQCELVGLARSSFYYRPRRDNANNDRLMRLIDEQYTRTPFYGVRRITACLRRQGECVNPKRVRRLMRLMGLEAIYPKPRMTLQDKDKKRYPYLLSDVKIDSPDHVWAADITYIRLGRGFTYLVAILDWHSRYVVSWRLSVSLEADFCVAALEEALERGAPAIFNTDQGSQFASDAFTELLTQQGVAISMDGRGRVFDNIFVERLWRTVKYEEVYLKDYTTVVDTRRNLAAYFDFYNHDRPHQALGYRTPAEVYFGTDENAERGTPQHRVPAAQGALPAPSVPATQGIAALP